MTSPAPTAQYNYPCDYRLGCGRIQELPALCRERDISRPQVVTDAGVAALPWFDAMVKSLRDDGLAATVFSSVHSNPIAADVTEGLRSYRESDCDGIVLVGGGAPLDVGKCIALLADNPGNVFDYEDVGDNWKRADGEKIPDMIAVPTTSGTGSEVGRASVIVNERHEKKIIFHPNMQPPVVLADPALTFGLPPLVTAFTGMDAYIHCFEAYCAAGYHPMADGIALEGMRLVSKNLLTAFREPDSAWARTNMMLASSMGATAFQKGLGVVHALSHALGGRFDVHHGKANAMLLPYCMEFNRPSIEDACARIASYLDLERPDYRGLLDWTLTMRKELGVPAALGEVIELTDAALDQLVPIAERDPSLGGNPQPASPTDLKQILLAARDGRLSS